MLEVKGELVFKTVAYHRAADAIGRSPVDLVAAYRAGDAAQDPGRRRGDQRQDRGARHDRPHGLLRPARAPRSRRASSSCCASPGSAPRPSARSTRELGIETMEDLREAAEGGPPARACAGCRPRPSSSSSRASPASSRRPSGCSSHRAEATIVGLMEAVADARASRSIEPAGSFRRRRESIGDLDLLAETDDGPA